ncbi:spastin [Chaetoceros tenuissimus]|uniref:Spastin n=1 Tax=Chaetoceros tenuissimus TaxID=426638 RepID=A0AAD3HAZ5_9STRA|nr:spastin [Chaetoceros tenuissimus]
MKNSKERRKHDEIQARMMKGKKRNERKEHSHHDAKVNKAIQELDQAESLSKRNRLEEASALYHSSIEYLLSFLRAAQTDSNKSTVSTDVLKERIKVALSDAERIKESLQKKKKKQSVGRSQSERIRQDKVQIPSLQTTKSTDSHLTKTKQKRTANLDYDKNDPFIELIKNEIYIDSKSINVSWSDISGLQKAKQALQEAAILPLLRPDLYQGLRSAPKGVLLYGPPGTGKTMLVKAVAHESNCILFACTASSMTSKWVGEGEKIVRTLFKMAADVAPSIIFLDELDSLLGRRGGNSSGGNEQESSRRFKTEFMIQMDGIATRAKNTYDIGHKTLLIGCTNCPWDVDDAIMRRFQRRIYVPLPDKAARTILWKNLKMKSKDIQLTSRDLDYLAKITEGYSCSDIASIAQDASFGPLRELGTIDAIKDVRAKDIRPIQVKDFLDALKGAKKSVTASLLKKYNEWENGQGAEV